MLRLFTVPFHIPGTLAANLSIRFALPCDAQLVHVQAVGGNANNATFNVGHAGDFDAYLAGRDVGDVGAPLVYERGDFSGGQYPHIARGVTLAVDVDFDGAAGTAVQNLTLMLTFTEG